MIGAAIYAMLGATFNVTQLIGTRIYPDIAPQNAAYPFVVYTQDTATPTVSKDGNTSMTEITVTLTIYCDSYDVGQNIASECKTALNWKQGVFAGVSIQKSKLTSQQSATMDIGKHIYITEQSYDFRVNG